MKGFVVIEADDVPDIDKVEMQKMHLDEAYEMHLDLHRMWTAATVRPGYDKSEWMSLDNHISTIFADKFGAGWCTRAMRESDKGFWTPNEDRNRRVEQARQALQALDEGARQGLFRELGICSCSVLTKAAVKNPAAAIGAVVGATLGAVFQAMAEKKSK